MKSALKNVHPAGFEPVSLGRANRYTNSDAIFSADNSVTSRFGFKTNNCTYINFC